MKHVVWRDGRTRAESHLHMRAGRAQNPDKRLEGRCACTSIMVLPPAGPVAHSMGRDCLATT